MAKRKERQRELEFLSLPAMCECCHKNVGEMNSRFIYYNTDCNDDCGDWVCHECEQEAEIEHNQLEHPPYG